MGIKVIDTANSYAGGESERTVGRWLSDTGADVVVTTKVGGRVEPGQHEVSLRADHIGRQLVRSIERLGRVDLYLSHGPDESTSVAETLSAFAAAQQAGLIRAFGCSNVDAAQLEELLRTADRLGIQRPGWVQNGFSLLARQDERDLLPLVRSEGLGCTPFSPLAGGLLSDRYLSGAPPEPGSRIDVAGVMYADAKLCGEPGTSGRARRHRSEDGCLHFGVGAGLVAQPPGRHRTHRIAAHGGAVDRGPGGGGPRPGRGDHGTDQRPVPAVSSRMTSAEGPTLA